MPKPTGDDVMERLLQDNPNKPCKGWKYEQRVFGNRRYVMHVELTKAEVVELLDKFPGSKVEATVMAEGSSPMTTIISMAIVPTDEETDLLV